jgi:hypothetical protein
VVPKTAFALLLRSGADPAGTIVDLCLVATVSNVRGQLRSRDAAVEAASVLLEGLARCGTSEVRLQPFLLARTRRSSDIA